LLDSRQGHGILLKDGTVQVAFDAFCNLGRVFFLILLIVSELEHGAGLQNEGKQLLEVDGRDLIR